MGCRWIRGKIHIYIVVTFNNLVSPPKFSKAHLFAQQSQATKEVFLNLCFVTLLASPILSQGLLDGVGFSHLT